MTLPPEPNTLQNMLDWLEGELRQVKAQVADTAEQAQQNQAQLWEVTDQVQRAEAGAVNLTAQMNLLTGLNEEIRSLRERVERLQSLIGQDQEQSELLARQLRAEMQAERDERGELRRRTEFAEQAASGMTEKLTLAEELTRRVQDESALHQQRMEQVDINLAGADARVAANAEAMRRMQSDQRNTAADLERHERSLGDIMERLDRMQEGIRRHQDDLARFHDMEQEFDGVREQIDTIRQVGDSIVAKATAMERDHESLLNRVAELDRALERARARTDQQDRTLAELRQALDEARDQLLREHERFLTLQEKGRRRQITDLEQEIRELKGYGRPQANG